MKVYRPSGVTVLAVLFLTLSILVYLIGLGIFILRIPSFYGNLLLHTYLFQISGTYPQMGPLYSYLMFINILLDLSNFNITPLGVLVIILGSGLFLFTSVGLFYMKRWGRLLGLLIGILGVVLGILFLIIFLPSVMAFLGIVVIILGIILVWYLMSGVKYAFEQKTKKNELS